MKPYIKPEVNTVEILLDSVILVSLGEPAFSVEGDKTAGRANWLDDWSSLLQ